MKTLQYNDFGGLEVLNLIELAEPTVTAETIKVNVTTIGLNPMDWLIMSNKELATNFGVQLPQIFGYDFSGIVTAVGPRDSIFKVGDRVFGSTMTGSAAEYILVQPNQLYLTPDVISDEVAATIAIAGGTAIDAVNKAAITKDDTVLIGGAAGGVGIFAIQLAKIKGAKVIGTASNATSNFLSSLGAEQITYGPDLAKRLADKDITAAIDLYSHEALDAAIELGVSPRKLSTIIGFPEPPKGVSYATGSNVTPTDMELVIHAVASGKIQVPIENNFPIENFKEAISASMARHTHGKLVLSF